MKPISIEIVPAQPGFFTVYESDNNIELGEPIIAWRIETCQKDTSDGVISSSFPLTADGDVASNWIGVQNPDMTVTVFEESTFPSLKELQTDRLTKS